MGISYVKVIVSRYRTLVSSDGISQEGVKTQQFHIRSLFIYSMRLSDPIHNNKRNTANYKQNNFSHLNCSFVETIQ